MNEKLTFEGHATGPWLEEEHYFGDQPSLGEVLGNDAEILGVQLRPPELPLTDEEFLIKNRRPMKSPDITARLEAIKEETSFHQKHGIWEIVEGFGRVAITKGGVFIPYKDTLEKNKKKTGKSEAATFGLANFDGEECVMFAMNWDFIGGSVGVVVGEKLLGAAQLAKRRGLPLVKIYSTGGMRQQENFLALAQMHRGVEAIDRYSEDTDTPQIAVLLGQVWGGTSASTVPLADTIIGVAGSNFGFAGPGVIAAYEGQRPPEGSQSVEANYLYRNVDVIVDQSELNEYLGTYLRVAKPRTKISKADHIPEEAQTRIWDLKHNSDNPRQIIIGEEGFAPALYENQSNNLITKRVVDIPPAHPVNVNSTNPEDLFDNYNRITKDSGRPDGDFFIRTIFDEAVPLYNHYVRGDTINYPPIISAIARIDNQPFLVIANQPSYTVKTYKRPGKSDEVSVQKHLATPRPEDFERVESLMEMAQRRDLPVITLTDTLGAAPTIASERRGTSTRIARSILSMVRHKKPVISVVTGGLGSGGGIATTSLSPELLALDYAQLWVAEPKSATTILHSPHEIGDEHVKELLQNFQCTPKEIERLGVPIKVVETSTNPTITARNLRQAIIQAYGRQAKMSERQLKNARRKGLYQIGQHAVKFSH